MNAARPSGFLSSQIRRITNTSKRSVRVLRKRKADGDFQNIYGTICEKPFFSTEAIMRVVWSNNTHPSAQQESKSL